MAKDSKNAQSSKTENTEIDETLVPSAPTREIKEGELVWYNERKGYGFVKIDDTEIFLHRSTLDRFGLIRLLTVDRFSVSLTENEHGKVIQDLLTVERPVSPAPPMASAPADDVFVHSRVLSDCGFHSLLQGQKLLVKVDDSGRGPQVEAVRLLNE